MGTGKSGISKGGKSKPKTQLDIQIENLEDNIWKGSGKAMLASGLQVGNRIEGILYSFTPNILNPTQKKGKWSGDYGGVPMKFSADNTFKITAIKKSAKSTEITATRIGGIGGTVKKKIPNDVYLRTWK